MGREIVYCSQCGVRILEKDIAGGRAFTVLDKVFCAECRDQAFAQANAPAPAARATAPKPAPAKAPAARPAPGKPAPAAAPARPGPAARPRPGMIQEGVTPPHEKRVVVHAPNRTPLYIASAAGMIGLVVVIILVISSGSGGGKPNEGDGKTAGGAKPEPKYQTPTEKAAARLAELQSFAATSPAPTAVVKKAAEAEKDIAGTPSEDAYRSFRKKWERKVEEAEAGKKIDALFAEIKAIRAADPDLKQQTKVIELLQQAEALALESFTERVADVKNLRRELEEPYETKADEWFEKSGPGIRQWMNEGEFKGAIKLIDKFPEELRMSKVWRVNLTKMREDCERGQAAKEARAAGKEPEKSWKDWLRIAVNDLGLKNLAKARESLLKAEAALPPADKILESEKPAVAWSLYYNLACVYAEESKKQTGADQKKSVDSAFEYLAKSAEAGVFGHPCRCSDTSHKVAKDHWDTDKDLETIRSDPRYAELISKHAK